MEFLFCLDDKRFDGVDLNGFVVVAFLVIDSPKMVLELLNNFLVRLPFNNPTLIIETPDSLSDVPNHVFQSLNAVAIRDLDAYSLRVDEEKIYLYFFCFVGVLSSFPS